MGFPGGASGRSPPAVAGDEEMQVFSLGQEDPLEEGMAAHSSILAWRIPMDSPLGLGRAWRATVHKIAKSQTRLK